MRTTRWLSLAVMLVVLTLSVAALAPVANAAPEGVVFLVTRLDDPAPDGCNPGDCSLREAVLAANLAPANADSISITIPGTIELSIAGASENNAATGDLDILGSTTIVGQGAEVTIVDANSLDRVFDFFGPAPQVVAGGPVSTVSDLTITGGGVDADSDAAGGGVRSNIGHAVTLEDVVVRNNTVRSGGVFALGGGVANNGGSMTINRSAVINNIAENAGGVANVDGFMAVQNSTISSNAPTGQVGGLLNLSNTEGLTATLTVSDTTITANIEGAGGGESAGGLDTTSFGGAARTTVSNSVVADNGDSNDCYFGGTGSGGGMITSAGYNLSTDGTCNFTAATDLPSADPLLGALTMADGTYFHPLGAGSPAIDSGDSAATTDQRGFTRPVDLPTAPNTADGSDRGAIEQQAPTAVALASLSVIGGDSFMVGGFVALGIALAGLAVALRRK